MKNLKRVDFDLWCNNYSGYSFDDMNESGDWFGPFDSQADGPDNEWRYVTDPTSSNYVIDMRHLLYVGYHLEQLTGMGSGMGDVVEIGQFLAGNASGLNWQDFFSNRLGAAFGDYLDSLGDTIDLDSDNFTNWLCEFLDSPLALNQRPFPNPQDCD